MDIKEKVAIIGGGPSGITCTKSMLEHGLIPTLFEKSEIIGGVWRKNNGNVWSTMNTNVSKFNVTFSDFPWPESTRLFPTANEVFCNLENYIKNFNLEPYIHVGKTVIKLSQLPNKEWSVRWKDNKTNEIKENKFNFVIVASGLYTTSYTPSYKNMSNFKGIIEHSQNYENLLKKASLKEKKIITVGASFSGTDISANIVNEGGLVYNVIRKPFWIFDRLALCDAEKNIKMPYDFVFYSRKITEENKLFKNDEERRISENIFCSKICNEQNKIPELYIDPNSTDASRVSIASNYLNCVKSGKITVIRKEIKEFDENGVYFNDGTHLDADIVLFCTGYKLKLDFIDQSILDKMEYDPNDSLQPVILYKATFHPDIENFACVGLIKEPVFPVVELQGRWAAMVFAGKVKLPNRDKMLMGLEQEKKFRTEDIKEQDPHGDPCKDCDELAEEIGVLPNLEEIKVSDPELYNLLYEGVFQPANYRLKENPEVSLKTMREAEKMKKKLMKPPSSEELKSMKLF